MSYRTIGSRLRGRGVIALPAAVAALALAPTVANAATVVQSVGSTTQSGATNGTALQSAVTTADGEPVGTQNIIKLCACLYQPSAPMSMSGNIEITGPPLNLIGTGGGSQDAAINGANASPSSDLFVVSAGATVLFKAFDIGSSGGIGTGGGIGVKGNMEIDNMGIDGNVGQGVTVYNGGHASINNSLVADDGEQNIEVDTGGSVSLNQDTITGSSLGGGISGVNGGPIGGTVTMHNNLFANNLSNDAATTASCTSPVASGTGNIADDATCGTSATNEGSGGISFAVANFNGGGTLTEVLSSPTNTGDPAYCASDDERFYLGRTGCDSGSYQNGATRSTQTAGPVCTVASVNNGANPQTMTVNATDSGIGLGPDAISFATTTNGSVAWPTVAGTPFDMTNPSGASSTTDYPSTAAFPVTATKPVGDVAVGDTKWSFTATNWLGLSTACM